MGSEVHGAIRIVVGDVELLVDRQAENVEGRVKRSDLNEAEGSVLIVRNVFNVVVR